METLLLLKLISWSFLSISINKSLFHKLNGGSEKAVENYQYQKNWIVWWFWGGKKKNKSMPDFTHASKEGKKQHLTYHMSYPRHSMALLFNLNYAVSLPTRSPIFNSFGIRIKDIHDTKSSCSFTQLRKAVLHLGLLQWSEEETKLQTWILKILRIWIHNVVYI